jgi:hypothetical protein
MMNWEGCIVISLHKLLSHNDANNVILSLKLIFHLDIFKRLTHPVFIKMYNTLMGAVSLMEQFKTSRSLL